MGFIQICYPKIGKKKEIRKKDRKIAPDHTIKSHEYNEKLFDKKTEKKKNST